MDAMIKIENLIFSYPQNEEGEETKALDGISLSVERGSFIVIIGRNGSGKSTLARCINALELPSGGRVLVDGMDTKMEEETWKIRQKVGMVFQNPDNQIVSSIVEDDIAFGPENLGVPPEEIKERVKKALKAVGMEGFERKAPHLLSGGQKQRIAIAGAIAMEPECIIFDEPTAMLDPKGCAEVMEIIKSLHKKGITCILITHSMKEAANGDRIIFMEKGKISSDEKPKDFFAKGARIKTLGMDIPLTVELADRLREAGQLISGDILKEEDFVEAICRLK